MREIVFITLLLFIEPIYGIRKELNPMKVNLTEFMETMQACGTILGFEKEFRLNFYGSRDDFNRTLCLSFCAIRKLKLYVIEEEIKKHLDMIETKDDTKLKVEVYKALDTCNYLLDDPCKLFDCFFDYAKKIDGGGETSVAVTKFFSDGYM